MPAFLEQIEARYGRAQRVWVMDRGIPTEAHLAQMRRRRISYLAGTPKGRLSQLEQALLAQPWSEARPSVRVKLLPREGELYVWVQSQARVHQERTMRRRQLQRLWKRLQQLLDVHFPTTDGRELIFTRHTEPEKDQQLVLAQLGWKLPPQPEPYPWPSM